MKPLVPLKLDVVVPTYNREKLLRKTLESFARACLPGDLSVAIVVVDNNSADRTAQAIQELRTSYPLPLCYIRETRQGLSRARNAGITASQADLIGFIDDDEEISPDWFQVIAREFRDHTVQFIGGPYLGNWVSQVPDWLPLGYHAVLGEVPPRLRAPFGQQFGGNLMGGNAVFRRAVFERVGMYAPHLGRGSKGLLSEEDADMQRRLEAAEVFGMYVPDLIIHHYIAPERLTRSYHRRWVFWRGASQGVRDRTQPDRSLPYFLNVPRYRFGQAVRGLLTAPMLHLRRKKGEAFRGELAAWDLAGFLYGRFFLHVDSMYQDTGAAKKPASTA